MIYSKPHTEQLRYCELLRKMRDMQSAAIECIDTIEIRGEWYYVICEKWIIKGVTDYEIEIHHEDTELCRDLFYSADEAAEFISNKIIRRSICISGGIAILNFLVSLILACLS